VSLICSRGCKSFRWALRLIAMDRGMTTIQEVQRELSRDRRTAWARLLLGPVTDGVAPVRFGQVVVGPRPNGWEGRRWVYPGWTFVTAQLTAQSLAALLTSGEAHELDLGELSCSFTLAESAQWERHASRQDYGGIEISWPSRSLTLTISDTQSNAPGGYLVGSVGPSFPTFSAAYAAFFYDRRAQTGLNHATFGQIDLRIVDGGARISRTVVRAASIDVWVDGRKVKGCRLELNSSTERSEIEVTGSAKVTIPLRYGLGQDPWLWLKNDDGWTDFRAIAPWGSRPSPGVEFETPTDPVAEVIALATQGENTFLEYKRELPEDTSTSRRKVLKTVVAFANGDGGTMLFGVDGDDDTGTIVGVTGKAAVLLGRLNSLVRDRITPAPTFTLAGEMVDGRFVIRLDVTSGAGTLYALALDTNHPEYYVRRNGSTYYARPEELAEVVARRPQQLPHGLGSLV
jgi:hypothetical protein